MLARIPWFPASRCFDLSRNKSLRTLETTAQSITCAGDAAAGFFKTVLSTIIPSLPLDVVITYRDRDFGVSAWEADGPSSLSFPSVPATRYSWQFKVFKEMYETRKFRLVLYADVFDWAVERSRGVLEKTVEGEKASGRLDYLKCKPLIISEGRAPHSRPIDLPTGGSSCIISAIVL